MTSPNPPRISSPAEPRPEDAVVTRRRLWLALGAIVLLAFALRLAWVLWADTQPTFDDDTGRYDFWAWSIANGHDMVNYVSGDPTAFGAPGYAFTLAAVYRVFGHSPMAGQLLNVALGAATVLLVFELGRRVAGERAGLAAGAIVAIFPGQVFFTSLLLNESLTTFLLLSALLLTLIEAEGGERRPLALRQAQDERPEGEREAGWKG